ncbi:hypothetical protein KIN20_014604 [Parelaphostrongylus tenuis]|uniref:Uncharacterized protein n=1 Tax=Parelaphostrongylus tenuis TaxID=148309 RepID=A0AAD5N3F9_PARTN|nr:hypothetical protein KIN20_014604 [Parelaphostrongylus tenuis]
MKTQLMNNQWCNDEHIRVDGSSITETSPYKRLDRSQNMGNNMKEELDRRRSLTEEGKRRKPHSGLSKKPSTNNEFQVTP